MQTIVQITTFSRGQGRHASHALPKRCIRTQMYFAV
jgi:hypothetical protein